MEEEFINFLKKHNLYKEEIIEFIKPRTFYIDNLDDYSMSFVGCYPKVEKNIIKDIRLCVPRIVDDITLSINIHEYVHLYKMYHYLNKEYHFNKYEELLPVMYELIFLKENNSVDYLNFYIEHIKSKNNYLMILLELLKLDDKGFVKKK